MSGVTCLLTDCCFSELVLTEIHLNVFVQSGHHYHLIDNLLSNTHSIFPLCTFHLYVVTFQQHLHMEYISHLIEYSRACGSYHDYLDKGLLLTRKLLNQGFLVVKLKSSIRNFYGATMTCNICFKNYHGYVLFVVVMIWFFPHSWLSIGFIRTVIRRVPLVEQELFTLLEHLCSPSI